MAKREIEITEVTEDWLHQGTRIRAREDEAFRESIGAPPPQPRTRDENRLPEEGDEDA